jgi:hypothetical protein
MSLPPSMLSDANLSMMISDLCAQHVKLTGERKERNGAYLKELCLEQSRRYQLAKAAA